MPGRKYSSSSSNYRYGFNGQEKSDELNENLTTAMYWEYDSRIGRRWNVDPIVKPWESPFACFSNNSIYYSDPMGLDSKPPHTVKQGETLSAIASNAGITLHTLLSLKGNEVYKKNPGSIKPGQSVILPDKPIANSPVKITEIVFSAPELRKGLDFMGGGAAPYRGGSPKVEWGADGIVEAGSNITEFGENVFKMVGDKRSQVFVGPGKLFTAVTVVTHIANADGKALIVDAGEFLISKTVAAPYYYTTKTFYSAWNSDYLKSAAFQGSLNDFNDARNMMNYYEKNGGIGSSDWSRQRDRANKDYRTLQEGYNSWMKSHSTQKGNSDE